MQADHAVPMEASCADGLDDDGDGATDCSDVDANPACTAGTHYAAPGP